MIGFFVLDFFVICLFVFLGVLSVADPANASLGLCLNVWECDRNGEVVYYRCKPAGTGACGGKNQKWRIGADGELVSGLAFGPPPPPTPTPAVLQVCAVWTFF